MCTFNAFSIGTKFTRFKMTTYLGSTLYYPELQVRKKQVFDFQGTTTILDTVERTTQEHDMEGGTDTPWARNLTFVNGFTWKITRWMGFMYSVGSSTSSWSHLGPFEFDAERVTPWYPGL